jgi:hypothetical protein
MAIHRLQSTEKIGMKMKVMMLIVAVFATGVAGQANAAGCLKGAVVGGVAGHYAGHHAVVGAVGGCMVGRHLAKKHAQEQAAQHQPTQVH